MPVGNTYDIQHQSPFTFQSLLLTADLFDKAVAYCSNTADEKIQHLIFRQEERIVNYVQRLAQRSSVYYKRDVGFGSTLGTSYHIDTVTSQCTEQFSGNTRCMLHVLSHDSHGSQSAFGFHRTDFSHFYFLGKLFVQYFAGQRSVYRPHTDRSRVLRRCLRNQEHTDAILCQSLEDSVIHTDYSHHTQSGHGYQARIIDGRNTLDSLGRMIGLLFHDCSRSFRIERILYYNRYILMANRIDSRRINHFRTKVAQLHCLHVTQFRNRISSTDNTRIGSHKAVYICPYLQNTCIECRCQNGSRIV